MIEECVHFCAGDLKLEGILTYQEDFSATPAILLCSPHPNLGGDIDNNVVTGLAKVSADMGFMSLRFNYRGVGSDCHEKDIAQNINIGMPLFVTATIAMPSPIPARRLHFV